MAIYVDDRELVAAHQAGDAEAFDELVREHRAALFGHAQRKLYCDASAEDAVQEALVRAYKALPRFEGEYRLGPWLHRIMANVCIDEIHKRSRDGEKIGLVAAEPSVRRSAPSPEVELGLHLDDRELEVALGGLSDSHREALMLRFVDGLEYDKVAEASGVSEQNARARVSRARSAMRAALKGVAVLPALLFGLMKRGEKAAAAASTAALPTLTEAAVSVTQAAPVAVPAIAKAAVAVGLTAAVLTPTADSAVHQAVREVIRNPLPIESVVADNDLAAAGSDSGDVAEKVVGAPKLIVSADGVSISRTAQVDVRVGAAAEASGVESPDTSSVSPSLDQGRLPGGKFLAESLLVRSSGAGRYSVEGTAEFEFGSQAVKGDLEAASWLRIDPSLEASGAQRFDGLLAIAAANGIVYELRLAGFVEDVGSVFVLDGLFRFTSDVGNEEHRGLMEGELWIMNDAESATMELSLRP